MSGRRAAEMGASVAALAVVWLVATNVGPFSADQVNDLYVYSVDQALLADGQVPFRDFPFEYPPLALVPIGLAGGDATAMSLLMLGCAVAAQLCAWALGGRRAGWAMVALPVLAGALVRTHFDLLPAALTLGGLVLVARRRPMLGLALLGAGTMAKLWPAAVAVVALAWLWGRGERRAAARATAAFAVVVLGLGVPFAALGGFPSDMVRFHLDRPVQIESTPATALELVGGTHVTGAPVIPDPYKSNGLDGGPADLVLALCTLALLAAAAAVAVLAARRPGVEALVLAALGVTLAFVALGKVLSPQYVCWLLPLAAVAWGRAGRAAAVPAALTAAAALVTQAWFPRHYFDVVFQHGWAVVAVGVRNALLLLALAATARALARSPGPAAAPRRSG
ncbi:MAG TPA: glycosyltransferase 87 family protein [Baekduia sp.]|nr:glycosyltransferase 87 family protein [Baekduia sp.]